MAGVTVNLKNILSAILRLQKSKIPVLQDRMQLTSVILLIQEIGIMKKIILLCVLCGFAGNSFAQTETFDHATYTAPKGWKKQPAESAIQFFKEDVAKGTYCLITLYKAVPGTANSKENFDLAWASLVKEMVTVSTAPEMQPVATDNGWEVQSGYAPFESAGNKGIVLLVTASAVDKMVNLIVLTNTDVYEKDMTGFLESISLKKPETIPQQVPGTNDGKNSILGTWGKSNTVSQVNNRFGNYSYNKQQYTFNADGSYSFAAKTYDEKYSETLLIKEKGNFVITENTITITPKKSVIEAWSKKNGADNWNQLKSTQKRPLEIVTYQFSITDNNLLLQTAKQTKRDGSFNNGNTYTYGPPGTFTPIKLPEGDQLTSEEIQKEPAQQTATTANAAVIGTWGLSVVIPYRSGTEGTAGSNSKEYTFYTNGTYSFYHKTFRYRLDKLLLTRESGTYQINENNITLHPQKSVIEAWSKKDGTDVWGKLLSSDKKELETATYSFSTENFGQGMVLILKASKETKRDGYFNNSSKDAWFYPAKSRIEEIKLPD